ncbi:GMP/IMP nucleotidase [Aquirhabdus sp.]|uniref:GMP/IMP nucleotidase n=1 Tax=Aquirhabdus sp. TaxID=2824160 RepID=UPI00396CB051
MGLSIAWNQIDIIMFDMDGTLLDLAFDNFFWREVVVKTWATEQDVTHEHALLTLTPIFKQQEGSLNWYSLPYWSDLLGLDLQALKIQHRDRISLRSGVQPLLETLRNHGKILWLVTNAHPQALAIKLEKTGLTSYFSDIISSHDFGYAKEQTGFWQSLQQQKPFTPARSLLVDDSESVLHAAHHFGLHVLGIEQPDSLLPARHNLHYPAISEWSEFIHELQNSLIKNR